MHAYTTHMYTYTCMHKSTYTHIHTNTCTHKSHSPISQLHDKAFWSLCEAVPLEPPQCCGLLVSTQMQRFVELSCLPIIWGDGQVLCLSVTGLSQTQVFMCWNTTIENAKVFFVWSSFWDSYKNMTEGLDHLSILLEFLLWPFHNSSPRQMI